MTYRLIQSSIANCDLQIKNPTERARFPGGRYIPLLEKSTVEWYVRSFALAIGIYQTEGIAQRTQAALMRNSQPGGMSQEQYSLGKNSLMEQERQNQLYAMNAKVSHAAMGRSEESMDMVNGIGRNSVKYSWEAV